MDKLLITGGARLEGDSNLRGEKCRPAFDGLRADGRKRDGA